MTPLFLFSALWRGSLNPATVSTAIVAVKQKYIQSLVVLVVADISYKCFLT
jgi:hypothetical protein